MNISWTDRAITDLAQIRAYIEQENPGIAGNIARRIMQSADRLGEFPKSGHQGDAPGTHELVVSTLPYTLIYRIRSNEVHILRVWHDRQSRPGAGD